MKKTLKLLSMIFGSTNYHVFSTDELDDMKFKISRHQDFIKAIQKKEALLNLEKNSCMLHFGKDDEGYKRCLSAWESVRSLMNELQIPRDPSLDDNIEASQIHDKYLDQKVESDD